MQHLKDKTVVEHDWDAADAFLASAKEDKKSAKASGAFNLPDVVFASKDEEETGLLNRAAPRSGPLLDWDPDIVETLDDDFTHEQVFRLEDAEEADLDAKDDLDDLFAMAREEPAEGECRSGDGMEDDDGQWSSNFGSEADDEVGSLGGFSFTEEETKTKFTTYSMSSSVIRRNEQLATLDDRFDKVR